MEVQAEYGKEEAKKKKHLQLHQVRDNNSNASLKMRLQRNEMIATDHDRTNTIQIRWDETEYDLQMNDNDNDNGVGSELELEEGRYEKEANGLKLESIKLELVQQLAPRIGSVIMSQLQEANPEVNLVIPEFLSPIIPRDASSTPHNGQSSGETVVGNVNQGEQLNGEKA
uniref:Uncharacterized protein n=1 Tax=Chenopodium quinoa TaxID=63459 RepID=A0A803MZC0_CHEQI